MDLVEGDQTPKISQFSSFLESTESFSVFSGYSVLEKGRGLLDVTVAGETVTPCVRVCHVLYHFSCDAS